jgi:hypothetical protein
MLRGSSGTCEAALRKEVNRVAKRNSRALALVLAVLVTAVFTGSAVWAAPVPSQSSMGSDQQIDAKALAAERELVKSALVGFGLTDQEAASRVALLTDEEVHTLASDLDSVQVAGQDINWTTTTVLLLLILVVLIAN